MTAIRDEKYIEFDFTVDLECPDLFVELILPVNMFHRFCIDNQVQHLPTEKELQDYYDKWKWRLRDASNKKPNKSVRT